MTERQKELLRQIPLCNNNISKAARKAGYSESYARSYIHSAIRKYKHIPMKSDEEVRDCYLRETKKLKKKFLKEQDNTNTARLHELEGKVKGLFKDNTQSNQQGSIVIIDSQGLTKTVKAKPLEPETVKADGHPTEEGM